MSNYPGRTKGTRRIVVWHKNQRHEKVIRGGKRDAEEYEARWRVDLASGEPVDPRTVPAFSEFCASRYRPHAEKHLKASTWQKVRIYQLETLSKHFGRLKLTEITLAQVETFKGARLAEGRKPSSINNELRVLRTVLNWARELGYRLPVLKWKRLPIRGQGRVKAWTAAQVDSLFVAAQAEVPELVAMLVGLVNTGCRKGEAIAMEWDWVDLPAGLIRIPSNEAWQPKSGLPREIPISDALRAVLTAPRRNDRYVFPNLRGGRYVDFPKDLFDRIRKRAKVTGGPHCCRHTYASHFLKDCPDMRLLADVMGHSHQRVTELYSWMLPDHLAKARNVVNLGPKLRTVAVAMAAKKKRQRILGKT